MIGLVVGDYNVAVFSIRSIIMNISSQALAGLTELSQTITPMCGMLVSDKNSCC